MGKLKLKANDRVFKSRLELEFLNAEYQKNPNWDYKKIKQISLTLDLKYIKVYKWMWEKRQKEKIL